ncbi:hypothetical protein KOY49_04415 [Candidatus Minimicrobia vallesae]|uniref:Uncharacterized protein n=1 Tax=Candidatus Minimicrobia vallesae TaxID=2841264 RepID=A0A8F1MAB6_9BACT|nr:hypothetical protein KOY49_04415 [Candidatus Minimicrobia vallesae]
MLVFAVGSTIFAIVSPKILGGATNQIVDDYVSMKAYAGDHSVSCQMVVSLPAVTFLGADVLERLPNQSEIEVQIPSSQLDSIQKA